jgi:hypothetical protein
MYPALTGSPQFIACAIDVDGHDCSVLVLTSINEVGRKVA